MYAKNSSDFSRGSSPSSVRRLPLSHSGKLEIPNPWTKMLVENKGKWKERATKGFFSFLIPSLRLSNDCRRFRGSRAESERGRCCSEERVIFCAVFFHIFLQHESLYVVFFVASLYYCRGYQLFFRRIITALARRYYYYSSCRI